MDEPSPRQAFAAFASSFEALRCELTATQVALLALIELHPTPNIARAVLHAELERWIASGLASDLGDKGVDAFAKLQQRLTAKPPSQP